MSEKNMTLDDVILTMLGIWVRIKELEKERPDYKYTPGVGYYCDPYHDNSFIEYCQLWDEYKRLSKLAESMDTKLLLRKYYYYNHI